MKSRSIEQWATVAVTALPRGWRNVFDGESGPIYSDCPAILLQELRVTEHYQDEPRDDGTFSLTPIRTERHNAPYETRAIFGDADADCGEVIPVSEADNYERTEGPNR